MAGISVFSKFEEVRLAVMAVIRGEQNNVGLATLAVGTSTTVSHPNCAPNKSVQLTPASAGALTAAAWVPTATVKKGSFVIQHASGHNGQLFHYEITGGG